MTPGHLEEDGVIEYSDTSHLLDSLLSHHFSLSSLGAQVWDPEIYL